MRRALAILAVVIAAALCALLGLDLRRARPDSPPQLITELHGEGQLRVGAGKAEIAVPYPVVPAGYGPLQRHQVTGAAQPQMARALSLQVGAAKLTLVSVDLLEIDSRLLADLRPRLPADAGAVWVCATHTHSGMGNYDPNLLAQLAGTGRYKPAAREALLAAMVQSVAAATADRALRALEARRGIETSTADRSRSSDAPDRDSVELSFVADGLPRLGIIEFAAHPTTVPRPAQRLDADFPGRIEAAGPGELRLFLQGAEGNAGAPRGQPHFGDSIRRIDPPLALASASLALPPIAIHTGPRWTRRGAANLVDRLAAPQTATLSVARLGPLTFVAVPGEPTAAAGRLMKAAVGDPDAIVLGLCNGYLGYIETPDRVDRNVGETPRQYFDASLLGRLTSAAHLASSALDVSAQPRVASPTSR